MQDGHVILSRFTLSKKKLLTNCTKKHKKYCDTQKNSTEIILKIGLANKVVKHQRVVKNYHTFLLPLNTDL